MKRIRQPAVEADVCCRVVERHVCCSTCRDCECWSTQRPRTCISAYSGMAHSRRPCYAEECRCGRQTSYSGPWLATRCSHIGVAVRSASSAASRACRSVGVSAVRCRACLHKHVDDELSRFPQTAVDMVVSPSETGTPSVAPRPRAQLYSAPSTSITGDVVSNIGLI
jgi:hypothetical protein